MLRIRNMDPHQRARKNDTVDATQNAPTHHTNKTKIQKTNRETKRLDQRRQRRKRHQRLEQHCDESEDGQNSISHKDQDSDASFEIDTDEKNDMILQRLKKKIG